MISIDSASLLVQVMPLPKLMLTQFTYASMRRKYSMGLKVYVWVKKGVINGVYLRYAFTEQ